MPKKIEISAFEHLEVHLVGEIQKQIDSENIFAAHLLICVGIEFLGSLLDNHPIEKYNESTNRFKLALSQFPDKRYHEFEDILVSKYRGGLIHQYRIGEEILLFPLSESVSKIHMKYSNNILHLD